VPATSGGNAVGGVWFRHIAAGRQALGMPPVEAAGRWQRYRVVGAIYLADSSETAWAEFYRAAAEAQVPPDAWMPRDLWRYEVALDDVVDLSSDAALQLEALPATEPDRGQWPAYQLVGERLAAGGAQAILYRSAARPEQRALCVFAAALDDVTPLDHTRVVTAPAPPRGMRT
jgi:RES domain-containing protein